MKCPELLSPAGSVEMLHASVRGGCDAVYLGLQSLNARRGAENFDINTLSSAVRYCHLRGVRVYVAMNTLILDSELNEALSLANECAKACVDAFIVQDIGFAARLRKHLPNVALHASTQMNTHTEDGILALAELGIKRITLARELSLTEIAHLTDVAHKCGLETEAFAHGALCVCYSGQCLMSSMIGARSANRGLCAGACRLPYTLINSDETNPSKHSLCKDGKHPLSTKDLCTVTDIDKLCSTGVDSLKIEGRIKSADYAFLTTQVYREALDGISNGKATFKQDDVEKKLQSVFSRGFTDAYLFGDRSSAMMSYSRPNNRGEQIGRVSSVNASNVIFKSDRDLICGDILEVWTSRGNVSLKLDSNFSQNGKTVTVSLFDTSLRSIKPSDRVFRVRSANAAYVDDEREPKIAVCGEVILQKRCPLQMSLTPVFDTNLCVVVQGDDIEAARTKVVTKEEVAEHIGRMGQTSFVLQELDIVLEDGVGVSFSKLHKLRSEAVEKLESAILTTYHPDKTTRHTQISSLETCEVSDFESLKGTATGAKDGQ